MSAPPFCAGLLGYRDGQWYGVKPTPTVVGHFVFAANHHDRPHFMKLSGAHAAVLVPSSPVCRPYKPDYKPPCTCGMPQ